MADGTPFIIYALPRSRTFWLSQFLTTAGYHCHHDIGRYLRTLDDLRSLAAMQLTGFAETSAALHWRVIQHHRPDAKVVVIRRPVEDVVNSLMAIDLGPAARFDRQHLTRLLTLMDRQLDKIESLPGVLTVKYGDLTKEGTCRAVFEHCIPGAAFDHHRWWRMNGTNLQCDFPAMVRYTAANIKQIKRFQSQMRAELRRLRETGKIVGKDIATKTPDDMAVTFQVGTVDQWRYGGAELIDEHIAEIDPRPGETFDLNYGLMTKCENANVYTTVLAVRGNAIVGYMHWITGPSFDDPGKRVVNQSTSFITKSARGAGPRMLQYCIDKFKAEGCHEMILRAGYRGSGPKYGTLFRRKGAVSQGELYGLDLTQ